MIQRQITAKLQERLFKKKLILITGPRQVGKTTLVRHLLDLQGPSSQYLNADEPDIRQLLTDVSSTELKRIIGDNKLIVIDEAQRISNIGITLKLLVDQIPEVQVIVTGSSSLDLSDRIKEPLTGRKYEFNLYPLSTKELINHFGYLEEKRMLETRLIYGNYPDIVNHPGDEEELLTNLSDSYLYKDVLAHNDIRSPELLSHLLEALALQLGNEVNYNELADTVGKDPKTVRKYIQLLEKSFVIFRLRALSRNVRNEIKKSRKVFFYDNGVRNSIIRNFKPINLRNDKGALWENFIISERLKLNRYNFRQVKPYFWRTKQQQEIDYIEEYNGDFYAYEFKYNPKRSHHWTKTFLNNYSIEEKKVIHNENYIEFLNKKPEN
jgi:hypothetical protein